MHVTKTERGQVFIEGSPGKGDPVIVFKYLNVSVSAWVGGGEMFYVTLCHCPQCDS